MRTTWLHMRTHTRHNVHRTHPKSSLTFQNRFQTRSLTHVATAQARVYCRCGTSAEVVQQGLEGEAWRGPGTP